MLAGVFSDEAGDYPAGSYLRNPPGSGHAPFSRDGATIFVRLWQMSPEESGHVCIDTADPRRWATVDGRERCVLFADAVEHVRLERLGPHEPLFTEAVDGVEILVLHGTLHEGPKAYPHGSWLRLPPGRYSDFAAGGAGTTLYLKIGRQEAGGMALEPS